MSPILLRIFYLIILISIWALPVCGQHKAWRQYTIDDGLTGNEVFEVMQDSRGYLWFATNQGICRFNGYEFSRPADTSAFIGNEAFKPTEDAEGRIWFARLDKSIWVIENNIIRPWKYNHVLNLYKERFGLIDQLAVDDNKTVWIALRGHGFLQVDSMGNHQIRRGSDNFNILFTKIGKVVISATQFWDLARGEASNKIGGVDLVYLKSDKLIKIQQNNKSVQSTELGRVWPLKKGDLFFSYNNEVSIISETSITSRFATKFNNPKILETTDGQILVASYLGDHKGLFYFKSLWHFQKDIGENILPGYKVSDILIDRESGWWAATLDGGVFYCKNPEINIYDKSVGFSSSNVLRLTNDGNNNIYASLPPEEIWKIKGSKAELIATSPPGPFSGDISALFYDTLNHRLWRSPIEFFEDGQWNDIRNPATDGKSLMHVKDFSPDPWGKSIWMSSPYGFYNIDHQTLKLKYFTDPESDIDMLRTFSVAQDKQGNIWVATIDGLRIWKNTQYHNPNFTHPVLRYQARDIELLLDGTMVIAFRGGGILIKNSDGTLDHLTTKNGLSSDFISKLYSSSDGEVYACSNKGLNKLSFRDDIWNIEIITTKHGLPSNLINDVTILNGELWIATEKGLAQIKMKPAKNPISIPSLEKFSVNNKDSLYYPQIQLPHYKNNITLKFYSLHFRSEGDIRYRYRLLNSDSTFIYTTNREIYFPNLSAGQYIFEVQAQNEDGLWSAPAKWSFEILAPWWKTWWFISFILITILGVIIIFYINRIKVIRQDNEIKNKIKDLEMAALRAQMNPHFIFNCLGSIQQFISENDNESATHYLSKFAKLIRLSLHSSVDGKHSLAEEIAMLDNYLALELMRFNSKFEYTIIVDPNIITDDIFLPPMLIQPFVENALKHGMKNKSQGGLINIDFSMDIDTLVVSVSDNGPGFDIEHSAKDKMHKSFGMSLTQKRLDILSEGVDVKNFTMETLHGPNHETLGSRVIIRIPRV